jgi:hypothetical protein
MLQGPGEQVPCHSDCWLCRSAPGNSSHFGHRAMRPAIGEWYGFIEAVSYCGRGRWGVEWGRQAIETGHQCRIFDAANDSVKCEFVGVAKVPLNTTWAGQTRAP